jgi:hypothetical protein
MYGDHYKRDISPFNLRSSPKIDSFFTYSFNLATGTSGSFRLDERGEREEGKVKKNPLGVEHTMSDSALA